MKFPPTPEGFEKARKWADEIGKSYLFENIRSSYWTLYEINKLWKEQNHEQ